MKKIILAIAFVISTTCIFASNVIETNEEINEGSMNASGVIEFLVEANAAVNDLCNYFNGSWVDIGLTVYCSIGGDVYTCTAYKVVKAACTINGAVRLIIEGNYEPALKRAIGGATQVYTISKNGQRSFKISEAPAAYTPVPDNYYR